MKVEIFDFLFKIVTSYRLVINSLILYDLNRKGSVIIGN